LYNIYIDFRYKRAARFAKSSHYRGACLSKLQQRMVDVSYNHATSFVPFSSVSISFIMFIIAFTSFIYTMFYVSSVNIEETEETNDFTSAINGILWFVAMIFCATALITVLV
jgi:uncharacterized membrane protein